MAPRTNNARIAFIAQKRNALKQRISALTKAVENDSLERIQAKLRLGKLTKLFDSYEEWNDELVTLDPENVGIAEMHEIENAYFDIAGKIAEMDTERTTSHNADNSLTDHIERPPQLPTAELPTFDGDYNHWISFVNSFKSIINDRPDLSKTVKFMYLKNCLKGKALEKIAHFVVSPDSYDNAWKLLKDSFEKRRVLIAKHYDAIFDLEVPSTVTPTSLSKIVNVTTQNLSALRELGISCEPTMVVRKLERILPPTIREEWEKTLNLDNFPTLDEFYSFINNLTFRMDSVGSQSCQVSNDSFNAKRKGGSVARASKMHKNGKGERSFITNHIQPCSYCTDSHPTFKCEKFNGLNVQQRWDAVKSKKLCRNCLRNHEGNCSTSSRCKHCSRYHHTLLHAFKPINPTSNQRTNQLNNQRPT